MRRRRRVSSLVATASFSLLHWPPGQQRQRQVLFLVVLVLVLVLVVSPLSLLDAAEQSSPLPRYGGVQPARWLLLLLLPFLPLPSTLVLLSKTRY